MRKGTVLYLTDGASLSESEDAEDVLTRSGIEPEWTVVSGAGSEDWDAEDALRLLILRGATVVEAVTAQVDGDGAVRPFGAPLRLFG